jgi:hypothetical protein
MNRLRIHVALALIVLSGGSALAQDPPKPEPERPVIDVPLPGAQDDLQRQMLKLFGEVETRLREIDKLLADAGVAQRSGESASPRTAELVKRSQDRGKQVVEAIDKILELAAQQEQQQGQGGSGMGREQGPGEPGAQGAPQGKRETTTQRESTPDKPGSGKGEKPEGSKPDASGNPRGNKKTEGEGKNTAGKTPPGQETEKAVHGADARESWGYLPEHARDVFRTQGGGQMPARYREWIDAYYKRLNQRP